MTLDNVSQLPERPVKNDPGHPKDHEIIHAALKEIKTNLDKGQSYVDVEDFRQSSDTADHQMVQRAVIYAKDNRIKEVRMKASNYVFKQGINMNGCSRLKVSGNGIRSTEIFVPGTASNNQVDSVFWTSGPCSNLTFTDFSVKGTVVDDATGPRRARVFSPTPGFSQAFTFRGDRIPANDGSTPNPAYPKVENIKINNVAINGSRTLPFIFSGVSGTAEVTNSEFRNTMDPGWIYCERVVAHNLVSVLSADNGFSFSRGNKSVIASGLYAINPAFYGVWVSGFLTTDGPAGKGPENFNISNVSIMNAGLGGIVLDNGPKNGKITGVYINGVSRGPSDEPDGSGGIGIRFGGYPSDNRTTPTDYASNIEINDFVLIDCAKGGIQVTGSKDITVRNGLIINAGSEFDYDGTTVIPDTSTTQNFGIGTGGIAAGTVSGFNATDVKVIDNRSTPRTNYPLYLDGTTAPDYSGIVFSGTRRTAASDSASFERRMLGSTIIQSMLILPSGLRAGANTASGTVRGSDVNGAAGSRRQIGQALTASSARWDVAASGDAESGSNAGSNFVVAGYGDNGTKIADYLTIRRSDGRATINGGLQIKSYTTATRPSAATAGTGTNIFDTTLGKPIWSDGTNWKDATGANA